MFELVALGVVGFIGFIVLMTLTAMSFRTVVTTNEVHIIQSGRKTISYGKDLPAGNVYYKWPSWIPGIGLQRIVMPVSVFQQGLTDYAAYDKGRVPFIIDIIAFFRIFDSNTAAQRVKTFPELEQQLKFILQGAIRTILASSEIEEILEGRSKFGTMFTEEVDHQLKEWGVQNVKCIELMDIRDAQGSQVISNIMAKKKSLIESESRIAVAKNIQAAKEAEIIANRAVLLQQQEAEQQVGIRTAEKDQQIGIATQKANQNVKVEEAVTATKDMAVKQVQLVRQAEIDREVQVVNADRQKQVNIVNADGIKAQNIIQAEGEKQKMVLGAEGMLSQRTLEAQGTQTLGLAKAEAEKALQLAPVTAQVTLAKEIGENQSYQTYLITLRQIEAAQAVGIQQAGALKEADIKIISNTGNPVDGITNVMDLFTSKGGTQIGGMLEALKNSPVGEKVINALTPNKTNGKVIEH